MRSMLVCLILLPIVMPLSARAATFDVGPGQPHAAIGDVPWEALAPGDTVRIHWRETAYHEKFVIGRQGTSEAWITVRGIPNEQGDLPVIDGRDATTRPALNYWNENRGLIKIGGSNSPADTLPQYIRIENLELRGARPPYSFTGRNGLTDYVNNAAAIYVERGAHLVFSGCVLRDCGNGLFIGNQTSDVLVEGCHIYDNGMEGRIYEHNAYTECDGIVYQYNRFGPPRAGALGNNLKDRSAGLVVRYNWIEGGNRQLDLVESDSDVFIADPKYRATFVYGNVLVERDGDGNSQILHYGGDNGNASRYRKGTLYFYHNTVVSSRSGNTTLARLSTDDEHCEAWNNILFATAGGSRLAMLDADGTMNLRGNWLSTGWRKSHSNGAASVDDDGSNRMGATPEFVDFAGSDFRPAEGSVCRAAGLALPEPLATTHPVMRQYVAPQTGADRVAPPLDLGALDGPVRNAVAMFLIYR
jgi:hypothetical protein